MKEITPSNIVPMPSRKEIITRILTQNQHVQNLLAEIERKRQASEVDCNKMQNEANQLIGRNDALRELYSLKADELQSALDAALKEQTPPPAPPEE